MTAMGGGSRLSAMGHLYRKAAIPCAHDYDGSRPILGIHSPDGALKMIFSREHFTDLTALVVVSSDPPAAAAIAPAYPCSNIS